VDNIKQNNRIETIGRESMPAKKYIVTLTDDERTVLYEIINKGTHNAQKRKRAQALLLAEQAYTDDMIAKRTGMNEQARLGAA
jgi:hypothetical protein